MGENPHQLGGMGEHCKLTIGICGRFSPLGVCGGMVCVYIEG